MRYLTVSMVAVTLLFTACGGGGGGGTPDDGKPAETAVSIKNNVKSFKVVANEKKYVTMNIGKDVITGGEPNSTFTVVSVDNGANASFDDGKDGKQYGILEFRAQNTGTYKVVVNVSNSAGTSANETFTFEVVSQNAAKGSDKQKVLATSRSGDFTRSDATSYNVVDSKTGLTWQDNNEAGEIVGSTYATAKEKCTQFGRLPTLNELLDIIDYSKTYVQEGATNDDAMLPDVFTHKEKFLWSDKENYFVITNMGILNVDKAGQLLSYRCVSGDKYEKTHIISKDSATGATKDYTTDLKWTKARYVDSRDEAVNYCSGTLHEESGWRLPTINELRSLVEDGSLPHSIVGINTGGQHFSLISDTTVVGSTDMHFGLILAWDRRQPTIAAFADSGENAKGKSVTCVKEF
jgi:hypothetical protein